MVILLHLLLLTTNINSEIINTTSELTLSYLNYRYERFDHSNIIKKINLEFKIL